MAAAQFEVLSCNLCGQNEKTVQNVPGQLAYGHIWNWHLPFHRKGRLDTTATLEQQTIMMMITSMMQMMTIIATKMMNDDTVLSLLPLTIMHSYYCYYQQ
jgi:hypothetical protein